MSDDATIRALYCYPIKGLSAQPLEGVDLIPGQGFPNDRMFGFARADSGFDPEAPKPLPKHKFLVLAQEAALARLNTTFDPDTRQMSVTHDGVAHSFDLTDADGRAGAVAYMARRLDLAEDKTPEFVHAAPHRFTDVSVVSDQMMNAISILNLDSLRDLERKAGVQLDPARFRANLVLDGWPGFSELDMMDREIRIGDARLKVIFETRRCAATEVNPETAERDLKVPQLLHKNFGHMNMGVYAEVLEPGHIASGDKVTLI